MELSRTVQTLNKQYLALDLVWSIYVLKSSIISVFVRYFVWGKEVRHMIDEDHLL